MKSRYHGVIWFAASAGAAIAAALLARAVLRLTNALMSGASDFAMEVDAYQLGWQPYYSAIVFPAVTVATFAYAWPILRYSLAGYDGPASLLVRRRTLGFPLVAAALSFAPWLASMAVFPALALVRFGRWPAELVSNDLISPAIAGFLASTFSYMLIEWITRAQYVPRVFADRRVSEEVGAWTLGVRARVFVLMIAVGFAPMFTMAGVMGAAEEHAAAGRSPATILTTVTDATGKLFAFYLSLGIGLTLLLTRALTQPLREMAVVLDRVERGDLSAGASVASNDEVGVLGDGVNSLIATMRDKERILQTFGHVVEPSVRDHLLSGQVVVGGAVRHAAVLFADLRGFTRLAEETPADEVVATLNRVFTEMNAEVREHGGFVDKFIGDAMLALFGLFSAEEAGAGERAAAAALRCAIGLRRRLDGINAERRSAGKPDLALSMGLHAGELIAGAIGSADRFEYTVIGDTVNVAARLQELCKAADRDLLVSVEALQGARAAGFEAVVIDERTVSLRGRRRPVLACAVATSV